MNPFFVILIFYALLALLLGVRLYGDSPIDLIQSGIFLGLSLGCALIIVMEGTL